MKTDPVQPQDEADNALGLEIIRVLQLKRKRDNGRIETTHGDKNPCGLARTVRQLSAGPLEKAAPDLLATLQNIHSNAAESVEWIRRHTSEAIAKAQA